MPDHTLKIYLAGPMRGIPNFNFPAFDTATAMLRRAGFTVFSPAERDRAAYGEGIAHNPTGDENAAAQLGCTIRECLAADTEWLCRHADGIALLPGWQGSKGACAERALALALGLFLIDLEEMKAPADFAAVTAAVNKAFGDLPDAPRTDPRAEASADRAQSKQPPLTSDPAQRKTVPMCTGLLDYFPDALAAVAHVSYVGNQQHNPGQPLHWARGKSTDEADTAIRHLRDRGTLDSDGLRHSAKAAWRVLALLQKEIEADCGLPMSRGSRAES